MSEPVRYDGLAVLPAAIELLNVARDIAPTDAVTVYRQSFGDGDRQRVADVLAVDWDRLADAGLPHTSVTLAAIARSLLEGAPVDLSDTVHFDEDTGRRFTAALALIWDGRR